MVEDHLHIVKDVLRFRIRPNESSTGLGFDDLYQEGCLWLCWAAYSYAKETAAFSTYAKKVVTNGLLSYCKEVNNYNKHFTRLEIGECGELILPATENSICFQTQLDMLEVLDLLQSAEKDYRGVAKLGIQSLTCKVQGAGITEIADAYQVPPSYIGAWISRASSKLRKDESFLFALR